MKQIVFLIGAFVVLLQLHSTTAATDSDAAWDAIETKIRTSIDKSRARVKGYKEFGESEWKAANLEVPKEWAEFEPTLMEVLDRSEEKVRQKIAELRETSSIDLNDVDQLINDVDNKILLGFLEVQKKIEDSAIDGQEDADYVAYEARELMVFEIETGTDKTLNILEKAAKKKSNARS